MEEIIYITSGVTAIATAVIAVYAWQSHKLLKQINQKDLEFRQQVKDLYQAIVLSNLMNTVGKTGAMGSIGGVISEFSTYYKGETPIFTKGG